MEIVKATERDIAEVSALYDALIDHLAAHTNYPGWRKDVYPTREDAEEGVAAGELYAARSDGKIVGSVILNHIAPPGYEKINWGCDLKESEVIVIHTLAVHPDFLHRGVGRALLEFASVQSRAAGNKAIRLDVYRTNTPAITLYQSCGFSYINTLDLGYGEYCLELFDLYQKVL